MIETRSLKILLKSFHEKYSDLFIKQHGKFLPGGVNITLACTLTRDLQILLAKTVV